MFHDSPKVKILNILLPALIYLGAGAIAEFLGVLYGYLWRPDQVPPGFFTYLSYAHMKGEAVLLLIRAALCIPLFIWLYRKDGIRIGAEIYRQRSVKERPEFFEKKQVSVKEVLFSLLSGVGLSLFLNLAFRLAGISYTGAVSGLYQEGSGTELSFVCLLILNLLIGPVSEELMHRGLVYRRMRTYSLRIAAILVSSLIFGLLHGDLIAGSYAFILGIVLADVYEWTGSLLCSVLCHLAANAGAVLISAVSSVNRLISANSVVFLIAGGLVFALGFLGLVIKTSPLFFRGSSKGDT